MKTIREAWQVAYRSFWLLPGVGVGIAILLGLAIPVLDEAVGPGHRIPFFTFEDAQAARGLLETVATVTVSVAGISFSVTVVALQLASQQLSPRVLRTFQGDRLSQVTLAVFLGTFVYCLLVLASFRVEPGEIPEVSLAIAVLTAAAAFLLFVAFIHNIVDSLQASTLIRRMAADGRRTAEAPFPSNVGSEPESHDRAERRARERREREPSRLVRAGRAGYLIGIDDAELFDAARESGALVTQLAPIGDFLVSGQPLAEVTGNEVPPDATIERIRGAFRQSQQRTVEQDVAFPIRQLADVALRGLSPSLNDPTTAENAMGSVADTLVVFIRGAHCSRVRVDHDEEPRFVARVPELDDLIRLGFEQVRHRAGVHPMLSRRLIELLALVRDAAAEAGNESAEAERQIELIGRGIAEEPTREDAEQIREAARAAASGP